MDTPEKPNLTKEMIELMKTSNCRLVLVGGINVGLKRGEQKWHIRSEYETQVVKKNAEYARKLAALVRENNKLKNT